MLSIFSFYSVMISSPSPVQSAENKQNFKDAVVLGVLSREYYGLLNCFTYLGMVTVCALANESRDAGGI